MAIKSQQLIRDTFETGNLIGIKLIIRKLIFQFLLVRKFKSPKHSENPNNPKAEDDSIKIGIEMQLSSTTISGSIEQVVLPVHAP